METKTPKPNDRIQTESEVRLSDQTLALGIAFAMLLIGCIAGCVGAEILTPMIQVIRLWNP